MSDGSISFVLDAELEEKFKKICVMNGITQSAYLRNCVETYVNDNENILKVIEQSIALKKIH